MKHFVRGAKRKNREKIEDFRSRGVKEIGSSDLNLVFNLVTMDLLDPLKVCVLLLCSGMN